MTDNSKKIILDLCGGTGAWSAPYKEAGYDVRVITWPYYDVRTYRPPKNAVYGILMAVDCTHFSRSGAQYWKIKDMDGRTLIAVLIAKSCLEIKDYCKPIAFWSLENPVGRIRKLLPEIGQPKLTFDPCDYGDPWTKRTQIYGNFNIPEKHPVEPVFIMAGNYIRKDGTKGKKYSLIHKKYKDPAIRSITPPGFARAFFESNQ